MMLMRAANLICYLLSYFPYLIIYIPFSFLDFHYRPEPCNHTTWLHCSFWRSGLLGISTVRILQLAVWDNLYFLLKEKFSRAS